MSLDGETAVVVIALVGNPFSPTYARARSRTDSAMPLSFSALNVAVVGRGAKLWSLTERAIRESDRSAAGVAIGRSAMEWKNDALVVSIDERTAPLGRSIRGRITLRPRICTELELSLDAEGRHRWWPAVPLGDLEVELDEPGLRFVGRGYHDANFGTEPLDVGFERWSWSRAHVGGPSAREGALLTYDVRDRAGGERMFALDVSSSGDARVREDLERTALPPTLWRLDRSTLAPRMTSARVVRSLEDGPFYARALIGAGGTTVAMHEELSLDRLRRSWVRFLSGFRMRTEP